MVQLAHRAFARFILGIAVCAGLALSPAPASAEIIDFTGMGRYAAVSVNMAGSNMSVYAGEITWSFVGAAPEGFAQTFYSYCVDLLNVLRDFQTVTVSSTDESGSDGLAKAAWLFNTFASTIHTSGTGAEAAGLQVAIWEALYDSANSLSGGIFRLNTTGAVQTAANNYLSALYANGSYHTGTATWLDTRYGQDQITARVSEPSTLLMLGAALLAAAGRLRNRSRAKQS
jgi:hypothetical protein